LIPKTSIRSNNTKYINSFVVITLFKNWNSIEILPCFNPVNIRNHFSPYIKDAMVIGSRDKEFVSAIINIDFAMVGKWAERNRIPYTTFVDLSQKKEVADLVQKDLVRVNSYLPEPARARKFVLMHKEFDPDEAELTRTRKLRRDFMEERYKDLINALYSEGEEIDVKAPVTYRDGRTGIVTTTIKVRDVQEEVQE